MGNLKNRWEKTLEIIKEEVNEVAYKTFFDPLKPIAIDERQNILYLEEENSFVIDRLNDRYLPLLEGAVGIAFENNLSVVAKVNEKKDEQQKKKTSSSIGSRELDTSRELENQYYLNPRFNFDEFVNGKNSEYAYAAAKSVAEHPSQQFNPLFIYGNSGLGKTHLMHAIGHYILKNSQDKKVLYISSEMFTNELISALGNKKIGEFKTKYREIDVLLIDDIQFIEGKESTEQEFFHTFNALYDNNKQIVISSDRPPQKLNGLDDRLTSRFSWSLTADIQPPDFETRVAILKNKAKGENIEINEDVNDVIYLIAEKIKYNVRELEGAFTRIISFSTLLNKPINIALAKDTLKDILTKNDLIVNVETIKRKVCKYFSITIKDIESANRSRKITFPRQIAMYLSKEITDISFPMIGKSFGGRDHTTVLHAHKKIKKDLKTNEELQHIIEELTDLINE